MSTKEVLQKIEDYVKQPSRLVDPVLDKVELRLQELTRQAENLCRLYDYDANKMYRQALVETYEKLATLQKTSGETDNLKEFNANLREILKVLKNTINTKDKTDSLKEFSTALQEILKILKDMVKTLVSRNENIKLEREVLLKIRDYLNR